MGLLLGIITIILFVFLLRFRKRKFKWAFIISFLVLLSTSVWYFIPFQIDLNEKVDISTVKISIRDRSANEVEITDESIKADILDILNGVTYQRKEFIGNYFAASYSINEYIRIFVLDDNGIFCEYTLSNVNHNESNATILGRHNTWLKICHATEIINQLDKLQIS